MKWQTRVASTVKKHASRFFVFASKKYCQFISAFLILIVNLKIELHEVSAYTTKVEWCVLMYRFSPKAMIGSLLKYIITTLPYKMLLWRNKFMKRINIHDNAKLIFTLVVIRLILCNNNVMFKTRKIKRWINNNLV